MFLLSVFKLGLPKPYDGNFDFDALGAFFPY